MQKYFDAALASAGARIPDFELTDIDGLQYSPGSMRGRVVLLDFWVAGSVPYEREIPFRIRARERYAAQGFEILGICQNLDAAAIREYIGRHRGMSWPQVEGRAARNLIVRLGVPGENASFLLDREGRIRARNLTGAALAEAVARLVAESP
ncbi:MAG: TlpA family protein disulfide reductase [Kiritimatiellae bacterium]|nr:TlpA family protein disulfide reductase [Kiritimatiellia bacterium]